MFFELSNEYVMEIQFAVFDVRIDLAPTKYNRHEVLHVMMCWATKSLSLFFVHVYEMIFQSTSHQKFVSLVIESLS